MPISAECPPWPVATIHLAAPQPDGEPPRVATGAVLSPVGPLRLRTGPLLSARGHTTPAPDRLIVMNTHPLA